jgi:lipopolysaccharide export system permease protein
MILTTLDRYVGKRILLFTLMVFGVLFAMFFLIMLVDALPDYGKGNFGLPQMMSYILLSQPRRFYEVIPVVALVGVLGGMSSLAVSSELVAIRAAGISLRRLTVSAVKASLPLLVLCVLLSEWIIPVSDQKAQADRAQALAIGLQSRSTGIWLRDGERRFLNVGDVLPDGNLLRVTLFDFETPKAGENCREGGGSCPAAELRSHLYAEQARIVDGSWLFSQARISMLDKGRAQTRTEAEARLPTELTPEVVAAFAVRPEAMSMQNLRRYVQHLEAHGQDTGRYRLAFWQKFVLPLAVVVMVLLAMPFVFQPARSGALSQHLFIGVMLGLGFVLVSRTFGYFGLIYGVPPLAGSMAPLLLFAVVAIYLARRVH